MAALDSSAPKPERPSPASDPFESFCADIHGPTHTKLDFEGIHAAKANMDLILNSAYVEGSEHTTIGQTLARQDFAQAIKTADHFDPKWIDAQTKALAANRAGIFCQYDALVDQFRSGVDRLPAPERQQINALTNEIHEKYLDQGTSAWNTTTAEQAQLMSILPKGLKDVYKKFSEMDRRTDQISVAFSELDSLRAEPVRTRMLSATFEAHLNNDEKSRQLLLESAKINPDLAQSERFQKLLAEPHLLSNFLWNGESQRPPQQKTTEQILSEQFDKFLRRLSEHQSRMTEPQKDGDRV